MDILFGALAILVIVYLAGSHFSKGHSSEYKEFAKEQQRNRARKEARQKEKAESLTGNADSEK